MTGALFWALNQEPMRSMHRWLPGRAPERASSVPIWATPGEASLRRWARAEPSGRIAEMIEQWLETTPPLLVYLTVALVIGVESIGVPLRIIPTGSALSISEAHASE